MNVLRRKTPRPMPRGIRQSSTLNRIKLPTFNTTKRTNARYRHQKRLSNMQAIKKSMALNKEEMKRIEEAILKEEARFEEERIEEEERLEEIRLKKEEVERKKRAFKLKHGSKTNKTPIGLSV